MNEEERRYNMRRVLLPTETRLQSTSRIEFISASSTLIAEIDGLLMRSMLNDEASTRTMNLFGLWMENTLPQPILEKICFVDSLWFEMVTNARLKSAMSKCLTNLFGGVDVSKLVFLFLPVLYRSHWSMFVLYINKNKKIPHLTGEKHYLLYFDSLSITNPFECMATIERILIALSTSTCDPVISQALASPSTELQFKHMQVPQQFNAIDCGFYVMTYVKYLIVGALQGKRTKHWLTKDWFDRGDVEELRSELHTWCTEALSQL